MKLPAMGAPVRPLPGRPPPCTLVHDLPLRGGTVLARLTLPSDLTVADAERIAAFVRALALPVPEED